jgi:hypothetical protein
MDRQKPDVSSNEIELYIRTYYSLLRSTGAFRVRSVEEAHSFSSSSLHLGARDTKPDIGAFAYAAGRLPECMPHVETIVLAQSTETFEAYGYAVSAFARVPARGRRRLMRYDGRGTLAVWVASTSDIDDLVPMVTAYQIEWNKMHERVAAQRDGAPHSLELAKQLGVSPDDVARLREAFGSDPDASLATLSERRLDLRIRQPAGSFSEYQKAAQIWWKGVERCYARRRGRRPPTYFVSSNTHALANLLGGYARRHAREVAESARDAADMADVWSELDLAAADPDAPEVSNALYYSLRIHLKRDPHALARVLAWDSAAGIATVENRAHVEVAAQVIDLASLAQEHLDPRVRVPGLEILARSDARILNIDYPLGMAAYHLLSRVGHGIGRLLGIYVMGKAATLNAQVGDVMISRVVHDGHSQNTYLFQNAFGAEHVMPYLASGTVLDNQKAVTVRSAFLQNAEYMGLFYREGYTVLEMEAGPYMSALYERLDARRHPNDEIVNLCDRATFDIGLLHYASDTPYSRRQQLLSKSLGAFGMDATYACAIAITRRILTCEVDRLRTEL